MNLRSLVFLLAASALAAIAPASPTSPARIMEKLSRGVVAVHEADGSVFVSWRLLASDPAGVAFNVYRTTAPRAGAANDVGPFGSRPDPVAGTVKLNAAPLADVTWFVDRHAALDRETTYTVRAVNAGAEAEPDRGFTLPAGASPLPYHSVPLQTPAGYTPGDASLGDLDGDGDYEIVLKQEQNPQDNSRSGVTGETLLQAYTLAGRLLWTINLGKNIREGAHYTQFMVYDLDSDGRAEVACKTADGTIDGTGKIIGDPNADHRNAQGHILQGPEFLTIFDGRTGAALATTDYVPPRHPTKLEPTGDELKAIWGDGYGNRSDRYLACVAYLDGERPSLVMCRGYYTRAVLAAWDWRDGKLTQRWVFDSDDGTPGNERYRGQGNHNLSVADVDEDGRDEIIYGAAVIDDSGRGLYSTGWGHGDVIHVSDLTPANPGLEIFDIQERFDAQGMSVRDARTGRPIFTVPSVKAADSGGDKGEGPGRGNAFNIDPRYPGAECWAAGAGMDGVFDAAGNRILEKRPRGFPCNFGILWDGDLLHELLDQNRIVKWNWEREEIEPLLVAHACTSNNGTKATPAVSADLWGDWREEVIWRTRDNRELRIYTSTIPTKHRLVTLMHDPVYRLAIAWQNVAYNQPPHPSFYLDESAPLPPAPKITFPAAH
ncbi:rhamnogalacturonan lyase [Opitutus terrae]|uniref:YesW n=1 Tax=Opitutus terrae (strain DSM 11246 / JCM 15787 / PB90-1) TaxID=452637 RepID=B1ZRE1_OPITP|nr:rhamnogalacturonan lyase [Opitutus terrae]ACB74628.1 YesW [Opitutus terrae PB90-1]